ncbi:MULTISPECIES: hypothetical protein [unclassified Burkholderia]|uniref:hypothetical protein n=1 Tax=unclassified Burkholderia TaxID=2613784 RepID=UPI000F585E4E|nr:MULTISPECIES: hypothetical protein [unclassified Burkholderia]
MKFIRLLALCFLACAAIPSWAQFNSGQALTASALNAALAHPTITGGTISGLSAPIPIASGGTNATTASAALANIGGLPLGGGTLTGPLTVPSLLATGTIQTGTLLEPGGATAAQLNSLQGLVAIQNPAAVNAAGYAMGLHICNCFGTETGWTMNPAAGDNVAFSSYINSHTGATRVWAENPMTDVIGTDATAWIAEFDMNNTMSTYPDPGNTLQKIGIAITSGGTTPASAGLTIGGTSTANAWKHGIWFNRVGYLAGSSLIHTTSNVSVDFGLDLGAATVNYQGVRVGNTPSAATGIGFASRQFANGNTALFLQRFTDTSPTGRLLTAVDATNSTELAYIDTAGNIGGKSVNVAGISSTGSITESYANPRFFINDTSGTNSAGVVYENNGTAVWNLQNTSSTNGLVLTRYVGGVSTDTPITVSNSTGIVSFVDGITVKGTTVNPNLSGTSSSIGGSSLAAGACASTTVTITNATTGMAVSVAPVTYPGDGFYWRGYVSSANTVTVSVCAAAAGTPTASTYNVRVLQ